MDNISHTFNDVATHDEVVSFDRVARRPAASEAKPAATPCGEAWYHDAAIAQVNYEAIEARANPYHH